jgi:TrmH family RNA methyltransferase
MSLSNIRIVLVRPTHPGNVGAAARAMKTMGLGGLYLVEPCAERDEVARAMAAGALDVLEAAVVCPTLDDAIRDCAWVVGSSARARRIEWPELTPRQAAGQLATRAAMGQSVALLFGQERSGLLNEELDRCQAVVTIPASPDYGSLNVAAAVQVLAYELRVATLGESRSARTASPMPAHEDMRRFYRHLQEVLVETAFLDPSNPRLLMRRLIRLFNRAAPDQNELNILRGILTAVQHRCHRE